MTESKTERNWELFKKVLNGEPVKHIAQEASVTISHACYIIHRCAKIFVDNYRSAYPSISSFFKTEGNDVNLVTAKLMWRGYNPEDDQTWIDHGAYLIRHCKSPELKRLQDLRNREMFKRFMNGESQQELSKSLKMPVPTVRWIVDTQAKKYIKRMSDEYREIVTFCETFDKLPKVSEARLMWRNYDPWDPKVWLNHGDYILGYTKRASMAFPIVAHLYTYTTQETDPGKILEAHKQLSYLSKINKVRDWTMFAEYLDATSVTYLKKKYDLSKDRCYQIINECAATFVDNYLTCYPKIAAFYAQKDISLSPLTVARLMWMDYNPWDLDVWLKDSQYLFKTHSGTTLYKIVDKLTKAAGE